MPKHTARSLFCGDDSVAGGQRRVEGFGPHQRVLHTRLRGQPIMCLKVSLEQKPGSARVSTSRKAQAASRCSPSPESPTAEPLPGRGIPLLDPLKQPPASEAEKARVLGVQQVPSSASAPAGASGVAPVAASLSPQSSWSSVKPQKHQKASISF